jgi:hypothetical protein
MLWCCNKMQKERRKGPREVRFAGEETRVLEELVHRPAALVLHVLEDVRVAPEGHGRVRVAEHLRDRVKRDVLAQDEGA